MSEMATAVRGTLRERTAEEIRVLLARRRVSAAELARQTGMKQSTLARRMTGEIAFDLDDLELIAKALGVPVADLLPRSVTGSPAPQNLCSVTKATRPKDTRPPGRPDTRVPLAVSTDRPTKRRPQRIGSTTRPVSHRAA